MTSFGNLFKQSVVTQSILSILVVGTVCYMSATGMTVTSEMAGLAMLIVGFFCGSKVQNAVNSMGGKAK